ncbi:MAG TPA: alpha/beta hydrolase, partial [Galbitalea sp.]
DLKFDRREATELRKVAPVLGIYSAYSDLACSGWKYGPSPFPNPIHAAGSGPILLLGTTGDPATPYADARNLAKQLDGGHLVTYHGEGHTAYDRGDACIDRTVDDYLLNFTVPYSDPSCH